MPSPAPNPDRRVLKAQRVAAELERYAEAKASATSYGSVRDTFADSIADLAAPVRDIIEREPANG
jgi:hypothetical protein